MVNLRGEVVDGSGRRVNPTGFTIHGAVHAARPEAQCVIQLHAPWGVALSMRPEGLLPTSQWAMRLHRRLGRHAYEGLAVGADEQQRLIANLGRFDGLILDNHCTLTVGRTVAEAFMLMHILERAAQAQLRAMAALAKELTDACVRVLGGSAEGVDVVFQDVARHDWATGGVLWSEKAPPKPAG
jgi:ribulose-5-phosphate 4-epimerase/fuculose-1-phosphate aldolase